VGGVLHGGVALPVLWVCPLSALRERLQEVQRPQIRAKERPGFGDSEPLKRHCYPGDGGGLDDSTHAALSTSYDNLLPSS
jgi:hypothetical protein